MGKSGHASSARSLIQCWPGQGMRVADRYDGGGFEHIEQFLIRLLKPSRDGASQPRQPSAATEQGLE